jgi:cell wall-associated NlpC family hydrolase
MTPITADDVAEIAVQHVARAQPWQAGVNDCWTLVRSVLQQAFKIELPRLPVAHGRPRDYTASCAATVAGELSTHQWLPAAAIPGAVALMRKGSRAVPHHVGLCLGDDMYAHCSDQFGATIGRAAQINLQGWVIDRHVIHHTCLERLACPV